MLRAAPRTYPSMNIFMFRWRTNDFAHWCRNCYGWRWKLHRWQLSPWLSHWCAENADPNRKLRRYGLLKMCYFCVIFGFRSKLFQKSSKEIVFGWKHVVLLGTLQKPACRVQKWTTLAEGLSDFGWPYLQSGFQASIAAVFRKLEKTFSYLRLIWINFLSKPGHDSSKPGFGSLTHPFVNQKKYFFFCTGQKIVIFD